MDDVIFRVINCKRHVERYAKFLQAASSAGVQAERQECTDVRKWSDADLCKLERQGVVKRRSTTFKDSFSRVEIAIGKSHAACWQHLLESDKTYMCVMEDDLQVKKQFLPLLDMTLRDLQTSPHMKGKPFDILHLINGNWNASSREYKQVSTRDLYLKSGASKLKIFRETTWAYNAGFSCYVIHRNFANTLLNSTVRTHRVFPIRDPIDVFVNSLDTRKFVHLVVRRRISKDDRYFLSPFARVLIPIEGAKTSTQNYEDLASNVRCERLRNPKAKRAVADKKRAVADKKRVKTK